jgi:hypothetical protein
MKSRTKKSIFRRNFIRIRWNVHCSTWWWGNDESYAHDFFKANERQRARSGLLMIPAERGCVHGGPREINANDEGSYSRRAHRAVTEVAMAMRRAIGDMSTRPLASARTS